MVREWLEAFHRPWSILFQGPWVTLTLWHSYRLRLLEKLPLTTVPIKHMRSEDHQAILQDVIEKLLDKKAMDHIPLDHLIPAIHSNFLVKDMERITKDSQHCSHLLSSELITESCYMPWQEHPMNHWPPLPRMPWCRRWYCCWDLLWQLKSWNYCVRHYPCLL